MQSIKLSRFKCPRGIYSDVTLPTLPKRTNRDTHAFQPSKPLSQSHTHPAAPHQLWTSLRARTHTHTHDTHTPHTHTHTHTRTRTRTHTTPTIPDIRSPPAAPLQPQTAAASTSRISLWPCATTCTCLGHRFSLWWGVFTWWECLRGFICRVGQNRICTPYMTVYLVIFLPKIPYIHRIYMVLANPIYMICGGGFTLWGCLRGFIWFVVGCLLCGDACLALYDLWWGVYLVGMPAWLYMICGGVFTWWGCLRGVIWFEVWVPA